MSFFPDDGAVEAALEVAVEAASQVRVITLNILQILVNVAEGSAQGNKWDLLSTCKHLFYLCLRCCGSNEYFNAELDP